MLQFLASHGESGEAGTTEVLEQRLGQLQERIRQKQEAADTLQRNKQQREQVNRELERARQGSAAVFERTKIPGHSEAVLQERIKALDDWRQLKHALDQQRSIERDRRGHLEAATELLALVETGDESELLRQQDHYIRQSGQWQSLIEEITRIRNAIDQAGRERRLEAARAAVQQARDELSDALDETLFADAGGFLLNQVSQEYVRSSQPAALRRAADWFVLFTRHQFQLQFPDVAGIGFTALDNSSAEQRDLSELSSGTRMQLLLAVRLAFALQAERGRESLPLILDETLTTSDPQRFQAVAESLHTLVCEEGRQIFYLSSQPGDIAYWREVDPEARILDLPVIRQQAGALTDPDRFMLPEREAVPDPGSDSAEQYAVRISVPAIALWNAVENMPIFYLLRDQLALLQRLLQAGIERFGQLQSLLATEQSALLLNPEEVSLLSRRCEAARRWQQARRQGQGRPIDRSVLEAAEAVSDVQLDRVDEQSRAMNGDAAALIQCLEDGKVSRFRSNKIEELCEWFLENGYIDPAASLNAEEIDQRVLSALIATPDESGAALQEAQELTASLENGLRV